MDHSEVSFVVECHCRVELRQTINSLIMKRFGKWIQQLVLAAGYKQRNNMLL